MTNTATNHNSSLKDIAKAIRAEIATAKKTGRLPAGLKVSVRTQYFAGGQSLQVEIKAADFEVFTAEYKAWKADQDRDFFDVPAKLTRNASIVLGKLDAMVCIYRIQETHWQTDYCHTNFFFHGSSYDSDLAGPGWKQTSLIAS